MHDEAHRIVSCEIFSKYENNSLNIKSYNINDFSDGKEIPIPDWGTSIYVLRLGTDAKSDISIKNITNSEDNIDILYIGGHTSGKSTGRYNRLVSSCNKSELHYHKNQWAMNDKEHDHPVAGWLTTSLLSKGFTINNCILDLIECGNGFDELELIIGYQEKYHQLPPWNSSRKGASGYSKNGECS